MFLSSGRRTIDERDLGNSEGGFLGGRGFPPGYGAGRSRRLLLCASSGFGAKHSFAGAGEASTESGTTHAVAGLNERSESTTGRDPAATPHRGENDSRADGYAARAGPSKRTRSSPRHPHAGTKTEI